MSYTSAESIDVAKENITQDDLLVYAYTLT